MDALLDFENELNEILEFLEQKFKDLQNSNEKKSTQINHKIQRAKTVLKSYKLEYGFNRDKVYISCDEK
jgi:hypothetical protein